MTCVRRRGRAVQPPRPVGSFQAKSGNHTFGRKAAWEARPPGCLCGTRGQPDSTAEGSQPASRSLGWGRCPLRPERETRGPGRAGPSPADPSGCTGLCWAALLAGPKPLVAYEPLGAAAGCSTCPGAPGPPGPPTIAPRLPPRLARTSGPTSGSPSLHPLPPGSAEQGQRRGPREGVVRAVWAHNGPAC